jgi:hypothetical protein
MPLAVRLLVIGVFGAFSLQGLVTCLSRRVAFRVDQAGITLGGSPLRYRATTRFHPWADIEKIVLWHRKLPAGPALAHVGLQRRADAPSMTAGGSGRADRTAYGAPVPDIAAGAARAVSAWHLDDGHLVEAVARFAPTVRVVDATGRAVGQRPG